MSRMRQSILPRADIPQEWSARADLYSDWFRYKMLQRGLGTWVDTDIYLVATLEIERPYLFGIEQGRRAQQCGVSGSTRQPVASAISRTVHQAHDAPMDDLAKLYSGSL